MKALKAHLLILTLLFLVVSAFSFEVFLPPSLQLLSTYSGKGDSLGSLGTSINSPDFPHLTSISKGE